jgi:hypothetical protein
VVLDGTLIPIDRVAADRPFYSGKHRRHGMNLQVIATPDGDIVWVSGPLPGAVHDLTAARIWGILRELAASGLIVLADKGYHGAGEHIHTPTRAGTSPPLRRPPTAPTPSYAAPVNAPTPSSKPGASCANSAAAPGAPGNWPRPSTSFKPVRSEDEKRSLLLQQLLHSGQPGLHDERSIRFSIASPGQVLGNGRQFIGPVGASGKPGSSAQSRATT